MLVLAEVLLWILSPSPGSPSGKPASVGSLRVPAIVSEARAATLLPAKSAAQTLSVRTPTLAEADALLEAFLSANPSVGRTSARRALIGLAELSDFGTAWEPSPKIKAATQAATSQMITYFLDSVTLCCHVAPKGAWKYIPLVYKYAAPDGASAPHKVRHLAPWRRK